MGGGRYNDAVAHALLLAPHCKPSHTGIRILLYQHQHKRTDADTELMMNLIPGRLAFADTNEESWGKAI